MLEDNNQEIENSHETEVSVDEVVQTDSSDYPDSTESTVELEDPTKLLDDHDDDDDDDDYDIQDYSGVTKAIEKGFESLRTTRKEPEEDNDDDDDDDIEKQKFISSKKFEKEWSRREKDLLQKIEETQNNKRRELSHLNKISEESIQVGENYLDNLGRSMQKVGIDLKSIEGELMTDNAISKFKEMIAVEQRNKGRVILSPKEMKNLAQKHFQLIEPSIRKIAKMPNKSSHNVGAVNSSVSQSSGSKSQPAEKLINQYNEKKKSGNLTLSDAIKMLNLR